MRVGRRIVLALIVVGGCVALAAGAAVASFTPTNHLVAEKLAKLIIGETVLPPGAVTTRTDPRSEDHDTTRSP